MSKKLIALVLFVAMMLTMVPFASAAAGEVKWVKDSTDYVIGFDTTPGTTRWFIDPIARSISAIKDAGGLTTWTPPTSAVMANFNNVLNTTVPATVWSAPSATTDVAANLNLNGTVAGVTGGSTFTLKGDYDDLESYYYTQYGTSGANGTVFKVPFRVYQRTTYVLQIDTGSGFVNAIRTVDDKGTANNTADDEYTYTAAGTGTPTYAYEFTDVTPATTVDGVLAPASYLPDLSTGGIVYYLDFVLGENDSSTTKRISYNSNNFDVTVKYSNTGTASSSDFTLKVVEKQGDQKANFNVVSQTTGEDYNNILYFDIAKRTKDDNTAIGTLATVTVADYFTRYNIGETIAAGSTYITIAGNKDGSYTATESAAVPAGGHTVATGEVFYKSSDSAVTNANRVSAFNTASVATLTVAKNKMGVKLQAINADGQVMAFSTTVDVAISGTKAASAIQPSKDVLLAGTQRYGVIGSGTSYFLDSDGCFILNIYGIRSWQAIDTTTITYYSEKMFELDFTFKYNTTTVGSGTYDVVFRNVERNATGITVLDESITLEVGETYTINFTYDNDQALNKSVEWKSVNKSVVKVATASSGKIEALALGSTLVYAEDQNKVTHVIEVFVVEDKDAPIGEPTPDPDEPTPAGDAYVVTASSLNVRKGPGVSYGKVGSLKRGVEVIVLGEVGSWMQIEAQDSFKAADAYYVSGKYLALAD